MALLKTYKTKDNFGDNKIFSEAYFQISGCNITKTSFTIEVSIFRQEDGFLIAKEYRQIDENITMINNAYKYAYEYLKTLEDFKDAEDC